MFIDEYQFTHELDNIMGAHFYEFFFKEAFAEILNIHFQKY